MKLNYYYCCIIIQIHKQTKTIKHENNSNRVSELQGAEYRALNLFKPLIYTKLIKAP